MPTSTPEPAASDEPVSLAVWYALFAVAALGVALYFVLSPGLPVLFDILPDGAAA